MSGKIRLHHLLIGGVVGVLGGYIILGGYESSAEFLRAEIGQTIQKGAEAMYFPTLIRFGEEPEGTSGRVGGKAGDEDDTPWKHVKGERGSETQIEDTETYEIAY